VEYSKACNPPTVIPNPSVEFGTANINVSNNFFYKQFSFKDARWVS